MFDKITAALVAAAVGLGLIAARDARSRASHTVADMRPEAARIKGSGVRDQGSGVATTDEMRPEAARIAAWNTQSAVGGDIDPGMVVSRPEPIDNGMIVQSPFAGDPGIVANAPKEQ